MPNRSAVSSATTAPPSNQWRIASSKSIHPSARSADEPLLVAIASGLAAVSMPWASATGAVPQDRSHELLLATEHYDAWLIHWPAGTGLDAHDHGGSSGAFAVVDGTLDEDVPDDRGGVVTRRFGPGQSVGFSGDHVHAVTNRGNGGVTSVHVYAPPLRTMGSYRADVTGTLVLERVDGLAGPPR